MEGREAESMAQAVRELSLARDVASVQEIVRRSARTLSVANGAALVLLQALGDTTSVALARAQSLETDELTGLLNRRGFLEQAEALQVLRRRLGGFGQVLFLDIDGLKGINDEFGHDAGDDLIRRAAGAVLSVVGDSDVVGRWGGDELVVFATGSTKRWPLMDRIVSAAAARGVSLSVGCASYETSSDRTLGELIGEADADMYLRRSFARGAKPAAGVPRQATRAGR